MSHGATWYAKRCRQTSRATVRPMAHKGMKFGIFLAPFHRLGENPTLAMNRDMELIEWLDWLGYDEVWIGEHHSAGWEVIASPEIFIGAAAERTKHIMLGSGVTSLPYHHPFLVAPRFVLLAHMTRRSAMPGRRRQRERAVGRPGGRPPRPRRALAGRRHPRRAGSARQPVEDRRRGRGQARQDDGPQAVEARRQCPRGRRRRGGAAP